MTERAVEALRAERDEVLAIARSLSDEEWAAPSDCAGWRVQDVVAHMASVFRQIVDPASLPPMSGEDAEADAEVPVAERRDWAPARVLAEYEEMSTQGLDAVAGLQQPPLSETVLRLANLGSHPLHLLANALVFDHYCHLRHDVLAPRGPIDRPVPPSDELRLGPTVDWMLAGLPQMCAAALEFVDRPVVLRLDGPGGGEWTLRRAGDGSLEVVPGTAGDAAATATSGTDAFVSWGTRRRGWRDLDVAVDGDAVYGARVLDAVNIV